MTNGSDHEFRIQTAERLIAALADSHEKTGAELRTLATSQVFLTEAQAQLTVKMSETTDKLTDLALKMSETTDKLNGLIDLVQRHVQEPHPGQQP